MNAFTYPPSADAIKLWFSKAPEVSEADAQKFLSIHSSGRDLALAMLALKAGKNLEIAFRHLEQSVYWANTSVSRNPTAPVLSPAQAKLAQPLPGTFPQSLAPEISAYLAALAAALPGCAETQFAYDELYLSVTFMRSAVA